MGPGEGICDQRSGGKLPQRGDGCQGKSPRFPPRGTQLPCKSGGKHIKTIRATIQARDRAPEVLVADPKRAGHRKVR